MMISDKEIDELLKDFDFVSCWKIVTSLKWRWSGQVVTVSMLKAKVKSLIKEVSKMDASLESEVISGGFLVSKDTAGLIAVTFAIKHAAEDEVIE